ncbi:hypothetical protein DL96DRAFT_1716139 [Flagelloscypha sp. PMI_526]|nr:hypothetical protein DL96DRAFT_1716139 [Flagelloscypha sp. PMI_526]
MDVQDMSDASSIITMDFVGDNVYHVFQIENVLFRLPAHVLSRQSNFFETLFSLPQPRSDILVETEPIIIPDTTIAVFERFCQWLLVGNPALDTFFWKDWMDLLRFAHKYEINTLFDEVLESLANPQGTVYEILESEVSDAQMLQVCEHFDLPFTWAIAALNRLCNRSDPLSDEEVISLEPSTVQIILMLRDISFSSREDLSNETILATLPRLQSLSRGVLRIPEPKSIGVEELSCNVDVMRHRNFFLQGEPIVLEFQKIRFRIHKDILCLGQLHRKLPPSFEQFSDPLALEFVFRYIYHENRSRLSFDAFTPDRLTELFHLAWTLDLTDLTTRICLHFISLNPDPLTQLRFYERFNPPRNVFSPVQALHDLCATSLVEMSEEDRLSITPNLLMFILSLREISLRKELLRLNSHAAQHKYNAPRQAKKRRHSSGVVTWGVDEATCSICARANIEGRQIEALSFEEVSSRFATFERTGRI